MSVLSQTLLACNFVQRFIYTRPLFRARVSERFFPKIVGEESGERRVIGLQREGRRCCRRIVLRVCVGGEGRFNARRARGELLRQGVNSCALFFAGTNLR